MLSRELSRPSNTLHRRLLQRAAAVLFVAAALAGALFPVQRARAQSGITSPAPGSTISGDVAVMGTAVIDPFQKYELHFKLEPSGNDAFVYFDGSTSPVQNGQLGVWRAGSLPGGIYTLRLRVVKQDGNYAEFFSPNLSVNTGPPPTPTPGTPTETPTPSTPTPTFTPAPSATPNVGAVQQPQLDQAATPTPPPAAAPVDPNAAPALAGDLAAGQASGAAGTVVNTTTTSNATRELGQALSMDRLRIEFMRGVRVTAALFLVAVAIFAGKRTFTWARRRYG